MFEFILDKTETFIRCLKCQYIDKTSESIREGEEWVCVKCGHAANLHELKKGGIDAST